MVMIAFPITKMDLKTSLTLNKLFFCLVIHSFTAYFTPYGYFFIPMVKLSGDLPHLSSPLNRITVSNYVGNSRVALL